MRDQFSLKEIAIFHQVAPIEYFEKSTMRNRFSLKEIAIFSSGRPHWKFRKN